MYSLTRRRIQRLDWTLLQIIHFYKHLSYYHHHQNVVRNITSVKEVIVSHPPGIFIVIGCSFLDRILETDLSKELTVKVGIIEVFNSLFGVNYSVRSISKDFTVMK